jgi:hypothetical protein
MNHYKMTWWEDIPEGIASAKALRQAWASVCGTGREEEKGVWEKEMKSFFLNTKYLCQGPVGGGVEVLSPLWLQLNGPKNNYPGDLTGVNFKP